MAMVQPENIIQFIYEWALRHLKTTQVTKPKIETQDKFQASTPKIDIQDRFMLIKPKIETQDRFKEKKFPT